MANDDPKIYRAAQGQARRLVRLHEHRFTEPAYRAHVVAIGQIALSWNDLHEKLGTLFVTVMGGEKDEDSLQLASVWSAANSDRTKREMLRAAVVNAPDLDGGPYPKLIPDVNWMLGEADRLEDHRNNAVHAPLLSMFDRESALSRAMYAWHGLDVIPNVMMQNARAIRLVKKEICGVT